MLSEEQRAGMAKWLREREGDPPETDEIVGTKKSLDYYVECWGAPQETATLEDGASLSIWRGEGYAFFIADFGDVRGAAVY